MKTMEQVIGEKLVPHSDFLVKILTFLSELIEEENQEAVSGSSMKSMEGLLAFISSETDGLKDGHRIYVCLDLLATLRRHSSQKINKIPDSLEGKDPNGTNELTLNRGDSRTEEVKKFSYGILNCWLELHWDHYASLKGTCYPPPNNGVELRDMLLLDWGDSVANVSSLDRFLSGLLSELSPILNWEEIFNTLF
jgi:hypothetical protein